MTPIVVKIANLQVAMKIFTKKGAISKLMLAYCLGVNYHFTIGVRGVDATVCVGMAPSGANFTRCDHAVINAGIAVDGDPTFQNRKTIPVRPRFTLGDFHESK